MTTTEKQHVGSFAPPLTDDTIRHYRTLIPLAPPPVGDAISVLLNAVSAWWKLPLSPSTPIDHSSGCGKIIPLSESLQRELFDDVPWMHELNGLDVLFESIPPSELRNVAFHLLWHAKELCLDREPITAVKVNGAWHFGHTDEMNALIGK